MRFFSSFLQTVLKGKNEEDLHYGYWRDECNDKPIFIAKNSANVNCKIIAVASNIFGAVKYVCIYFSKFLTWKKNIRKFIAVLFCLF